MQKKRSRDVNIFADLGLWLPRAVLVTIIVTSFACPLYGDSAQMLLRRVKGCERPGAGGTGFTGALVAAIKRHGFSRVSSMEGDAQVLERCALHKACLIVDIRCRSPRYLIEVFNAGTGDRVVSVPVVIPHHTPVFDVIEAMALKLTMLATGDWRLPEGKTAPRMPMASRRERGKKHITAPRFRHTQRVVLKKNERQVHARPPQGPVVERPRRPRPAVVPDAPTANKAIRPQGSKRGYFDQHRNIRLGLQLSYMTGFTSQFNTFGFDLSVCGTWFKPFILRIDLGVYPLGKVHQDQAVIRYVMVPIDLVAGYGRDLGRWYMGAYGGLFMAASWFRQDRGGINPTFKWTMGAGLIAEAGYRPLSRLDVGMFLGFSYHFNNARFLLNMADENAQNTNQGESGTGAQQEDHVDTFLQPRFLLTSGIEVKIRF